MVKLSNHQEIPIVFAFDEKYKLPASVAMASLFANSYPETNYKAYVLYDDNLSRKTQEIFDKLYPINWIYVNKNMFKKFPYNNRYPKIVYYRLLISDLVPKYNKIIWSDVDVFFRGDLSDVYNTNIEDYYWGGVIAERNDPYILNCHKYYPENKNKYIFWSGFMLVNSRKIREENMINKFFEITRKYNYLSHCELDILNICCNKIKPLPFDYCCLNEIFDNDDISCARSYSWLSLFYSDDQLIKSKTTAKIVHFADTKVWDFLRIDIPDYYWKFLKKSPFFNCSVHYSHVTISSYIVYILQCIGARILPFRSLRHKFRKRKNEYYRKFHREIDSFFK